MGKQWKKIMAIFFVVLVFVTIPCVSVLAGEIQEDEIIVFDPSGSEQAEDPRGRRHRLLHTRSAGTALRRRHDGLHGFEHFLPARHGESQGPRLYQELGGGHR